MACGSGRAAGADGVEAVSVAGGGWLVHEYEHEHEHVNEHEYDHVYVYVGLRSGG